MQRTHQIDLKCLAVKKIYGWTMWLFSMCPACWMFLQCFLFFCWIIFYRLCFTARHNTNLYTYTTLKLSVLWNVCIHIGMYIEAYQLWLCVLYRKSAKCFMENDKLVVRVFGVAALHSIQNSLKGDFFLVRSILLDIWLVVYRCFWYCVENRIKLWG